MIKVLTLPCGFRRSYAQDRTEKTKSFFFVLCIGVPAIKVIDYIFTFCNDMLFLLSDIGNHLFYHGVLNEQRLSNSNSIPLNDRIFLHIFSWPIRSKWNELLVPGYLFVYPNLRAKPFTFMKLSSSSHKKFSVRTQASHSNWNRGPQQLENGPWTLHF